MGEKTVFIASDHRGFRLKARYVEWMKSHGFDPVDLGTNDETRCDAMDYATELASHLAAHPECQGVLICGSGNGMAMVANRYRSVRAALVTDVTTAKFCRQHNDANVMAIGSDITGSEVAMACLEVFLNTDCLGGRYAERRDKLTALGGL